MKYKRHYLQFNDLVFDDVDADDESISFKDFSTEYTFRHGDYDPDKGRFIAARRVSMTLAFNMRVLPCDERDYFRRYAVENLSKVGRLWSLVGNTVEWAWAKANTISIDGDDTSIEFDVDFKLSEGVWHKASMLRTFIVPYDKCTVLDNYHEVDECDCCGPYTRKADCCCCDVSRDMALTFHKDDIKELRHCDKKWALVYDCDMAENYFGDEKNGVNFGTKICAKLDDNCTKDYQSVIAGILYSDTDIDTDSVVVRLHGKMVNPSIEINGNRNVIIGEYEGTLIINPDGTVYLKEGTCMEILDVSVWQIPEGNVYGWTIHPGDNRVIVHMNNCESVNCAYFEVDALTI